MTDITEGLDLLGDFLDAKGYTEEAGLCTRARDEINRLREALNGVLSGVGGAMSAPTDVQMISVGALELDDEDD